MTKSESPEIKNNIKVGLSFSPATSVKTIIKISQGRDARSRLQRRRALAGVGFGLSDGQSVGYPKRLSPRAHLRRAHETTLRRRRAARWVGAPAPVGTIGVGVGAPGCIDVAFAYGKQEGSHASS